MIRSGIMQPARAATVKCGSRPISRILSACRPVRACRRAIIPLGPALLTASSNLPGGFGRAVLERLPIWSCSVRGFACHGRCRPRGALLPHLFTLTHLRSRPLRGSSYGGRYLFCATFRRVAPPGRYPAHCPAEFGLSSSEGLSPVHQRSPGRLPQHDDSSRSRDGTRQ